MIMAWLAESPEQLAGDEPDEEHGAEDGDGK
jgi:hypothetical protein